MIKPTEVMIGVKIPSDLKKSIEGFCNRKGLKIKYFIAEALRQKLAEKVENEEDMSETEKVKLIKQYEEGYRRKPETVEEIEAIEKLSAGAFEAEDLK